MNHGIPFIHRRTNRSRSVKIHLTREGVVVVTTPLRFPTHAIPHYVEEARGWIQKRQLELKGKPQLISTTQVYYLGTPLEIYPTQDMDGSVKVRGDKVMLSPLSGEATASRKLLDQWLKNRAIEYCLPRIETLAARMGVSYKGVRFKQQQTCWGSCSRNKNLNFNWKLIHAPKEVIDYVIIHELAHLIHLNHGHAFWDLVAKFDPDHPLHRGWLKRFGSTTE